MMPDYAKAKAAVIKLFELYDRVPKINNWEHDENLRFNDPNFDREVKLESISFTYPNRLDAQILDNLTLTIKRGQKVALVGSSGCGKKLRLN
jgi:ABC-type bacteriocin/lantibiotic exporter with double-glycine peptidase domain